MDRGFRDAVDTIKRFGLNVQMPNFLNGEKQLPCNEANHSRCITKVRWIIEDSEYNEIRTIFYWVGKKFFAFFSKISWNGRERFRIFHIRSIYRWYEYCSNDNKIIEMEVDLELEMKLSRRELRLLLLHEFRLGRKATEATSNICGTIGKAVLSIRTA